jgi:hypothetical protein
LNSLRANLENILQIEKNINSFIVEPVWKDLNGDDISLCDGLIVYDDFAIPLELKQSEIKRNKAINQLYQGNEYIRSELNLNPSGYGIFVCYNPKLFPSMLPFSIERINLKN